MNKKIFFLILLGLVILPGVTFADVPPLIESMVLSILNVTLYIASAITVVFWVITGFLFLTAQGAPEKLGSAKKSLIAAVAGTVLVIIATSALNLVGSAIGL